MRSNTRTLPGSRVARTARVALAAVLLAGCGSSNMPDPRDAADAYLRAAEKGDVQSLRSMMTERAAREISAEEMEDVLERDKREFAERRKQFSSTNAQQSGRAVLFLGKERTAQLSIENGKFWVQSAGLVAPDARTVEQAVERLREALLARDFDLLLSALTDESARQLVESFERLEKSLDDMGTAIFDVREDRARIEFADGRVITLKRQDRVWKVEEIE